MFWSKAVHCWMRMNDGTTNTRSFKSRDGKDFTGPAGGKYSAPNYNEGEIIRISTILGDRMVAIYIQGITTPLKIAQKDILPRELGPEDLENLKGDFLVTMLRKALHDSLNLRLWVIVSSALAGASLLASVYGAYYTYKLVQYVAGK